MMKSTHTPPPGLAVIFTGGNRMKSRTTRRQQKHDMLLNFMNQLHQPKPVRKKSFLLKSLLSIFV